MATAKKKPSRGKTVAAKTANKKTTKKAPAKVAKATARPVKQLSKFELLRRFHLFAAGICIAIAIAAVFLLGNQTVNLTMAYSAKDPIASAGQTVLGSAAESVTTVEFRYLVAKVFAVSALLSILLATVLRARYEAGIKNATSGIRWIFMGVVSALILELTSVLAGVQDIVTLKLVGGLVLATTVLGWMAERDNKSGSAKWGAYSLSLFTGFLAWLPILTALLGTYVYGIERFGWHVYALAIVVLAGFIKFATIQYRYIKYPAARKEYLLTEEKYLSSELFIKLAFAAVVFIALID